ncbi:MAG: hypothetical protein BJG00_003250 [Limnothrix sp. CACIAM 69d]|nr:MAG: hypothetical protein BJG00_003250 [Limnothrix sp. CACIAM 69d]
MIVALLASSALALNRWVPFLTTRAKYAASHQRRLSRWLHNPRINPIKWWSTFTRHWWSEWEAPVIVLALDSTLLWGRYCLIRLSLPYLRSVRLGKTTPSPTLSIAFGRDAVTGHLWAIASDEPVTLDTFGDYAE